MKIALVHDYLKEIGGAEQVLMTLKRLFPEAPVYTAYKFPKFWGRFRREMEKWEIHESWGRYLPFLPKLISHYTILSPLFFKSWDLSEFDVVIVSATGAYLPNGVKIGTKTKLITYCHTPPRFLYGYPVATQERYKWYWRPISAVADHILRMVDFKLAQRPLVFIANSQEVKARIWKFYRREAVVVYPPVTHPSPSLTLREGNVSRDSGYYLMVTRVVGSKNIPSAIAAARKYGFKLKIAGKIVGKSPDMTGAEYVGEVNEDKKVRLLANARGVLCLEKEPDFGIVAVEPQMYGTPVIAYRGGGYIESVKEGVTGVFVEELTAEGVWRAIQKAEKTKWNPKVMAKAAEKFSGDKFREGIYGVL